MGKYIIELENDQIIDGHITCPMQIGYRDRPSFIIDTGIDITPYTEPDMEQVKREAYKQGLNDAREGKASCQFCEYEMCSDRFDPCRICACNYTNFFEPKKQEKEEIRVGDEVEDGVANLIVLEINEDGTVSGFDDEGSIIHATPRKKTGRYFPEIAEVLAKMKENNDNK